MKECMLKYVEFIALYLLFTRVSNWMWRFGDFHWCWYRLLNFWYHDMPKHICTFRATKISFNTLSPDNIITNTKQLWYNKQSQLYSHFHFRLFSAFHTCWLTSAPLLTSNSRQRAPLVETAARCRGV